LAGNIVIELLSIEYWDEHSIELDRIFKTLNDADNDARTIDLNKYFTRNEAKKT